MREELSDAHKHLAVSESRNAAYGEAEKILKDTFSVLASTALSSNSAPVVRAEVRLE